MTNDDPIAPEALRIMRAWPAVYGPGPWTGSLLEYGFLCGPGWYPLIERLSADLSAIIREDGLNEFQVAQVKEKLGGLRFYIRGGKPWCATRPTITRCRSPTATATSGSEAMPTRSFDNSRATSR
ncbi:hypothetical protein PAF19_01435 [Paracoccus fistulariae]|uniref:Uncharacterized protein n=1 Tax=Paracoccus fistulariae TaxID=658446 RepID=A0ABY7SQ56_9RHOB|nr:hypothetical protein [Paracoccus fistulariae]MDB6180019.1 hypothetical protein [Paracoccus fistulariae]WCR09136.1 hypothetical protein JHX87_04640 [Paracoccus fistulariae]